ncbi:MAG: hypothetical protein IK080_10385 [Clostridia bacterium]|nr:hypothetical protein [Clostridia bacterium]
MKLRITVCLLCAALCLLSACGARPSPAAQTTAATEATTKRRGNPMEEVADAAAFAERLGITLEAPADAQDAVYTIVSGTAAQIDFMAGGQEYMLRAQKQETGTDNLSGLYGDVTATEPLADGAVLETVDLGGWSALRISWTDGDMEKVLVTDSGDAAALKAIYDSIK